VFAPAVRLDVAGKVGVVTWPRTTDQRVDPVCRGWAQVASGPFERVQRARLGFVDRRARVRLELAGTIPTGVLACLAARSLVAQFLDALVAFLELLEFGGDTVAMTNLAVPSLLLAARQDRL